MTLKESEIVAKEFKAFKIKVLKKKATADAYFRRAGIVNKNGKLCKAYQ
jgi:hypothetical protein